MSQPAPRRDEGLEPGAHPVAPGRPETIDWNAARMFLRRRLSLELSGVDATQLDDLTQEALIRLLRMSRTSDIRNAEAVMTEIAHRTRIDFLRRRGVRDRVLEPLTDVTIATVAAPATTPGADDLVDLDERLRATVLEYFAAHGAPCHDLALRYFRGVDWSTVARELGAQHAAIRQRWTRCVERLRNAVKDDPGPVFAWVRALGEAT